MEQKAKRIGKLNIIDLIAIVLIVAVLALAAWKFIGKNGDSHLSGEGGGCGPGTV